MVGKARCQFGLLPEQQWSFNHLYGHLLPTVCALNHRLLVQMCKGLCWTYESFAAHAKKRKPNSSALGGTAGWEDGALGGRVYQKNFTACPQANDLLGDAEVAFVDLHSATDTDIIKQHR